MKPHRTAKYYYLRFMRLKGDPATLARGVAVGLFVGVTPTIPLHTTGVICFSAIFRGNIFAGLIASVAISNPVTWLPQYYLSWLIGDIMLPNRLTWERIKELLEFLTSGAGLKPGLVAIGELGIDAIMVMLVGGVILAIPFTVVGYIYSLRFFKRIRQVRRKKHILN